MSRRARNADIPIDFAVVGLEFLIAQRPVDEIRALDRPEFAALAEASGNCEILAECAVFRIETGADGRATDRCCWGRA